MYAAVGSSKGPDAVEKRMEPPAVESLKDPATMKYKEILELLYDGESLPRAYFLRLIQAGKKFDEYYHHFSLSRLDVDPSVLEKKEEEIALATKCMEPETMTYDEISKAFDNPRVLPKGDDLLRLFRAAKKFDQFYDDFPVKRPATADDADDADDDDADDDDADDDADDDDADADDDAADDADDAADAADELGDTDTDADDYDDSSDDDDDEGYSTEIELKKLCRILPPYDEFVDDDTDDVLDGTYCWSS